jgi:hypothetical protein
VIALVLLDALVMQPTLIMLIWLHYSHPTLTLLTLTFVLTHSKCRTPNDIHSQNSSTWDMMISLAFFLLSLAKWVIFVRMIVYSDSVLLVVILAHISILDLILI